MLAAILLSAAARSDAAPAGKPVTEVTLASAVAMALHQNPAATIAGSGQRIAGARLLQARAAWLPVVETSESYTRGNNPVFVFSSLLEQGRFGAANFDPILLNHPSAIDNYRTSVTIRYPLFDQFRRIDGIREASLNVGIAASELDGTAQSIRLEVLRAYYAALLADGQQQAAAQAVSSAEADARRIGDRVAAGLLVQSDLLAANVQLAAFREKAIAADGEVVIARRALANAIGSPHDRLVPLGSIAPLDLTLPDLDELLSERVALRSDIQAAHLDQQIAAARSRTAAGALLPRLDSFASWGASSSSFSGGKGDHTVGLVASWRVPDATVWAERRRAEEEMKIAEARQRAVTANAELEIVTAWQHTRSAQARQVAGSESVAQAGEALRIVRDRYEQGLTTITEVLRAQTTVLEALLLHLRALHDSAVSYAELLHATGSLNSIDPFTPATNPGGQSK